VDVNHDLELEKAMYKDHIFRTCFYRSIILAAIYFGVVHGLEEVIVGFVKNPPTHLNPTAFLTLFLYESMNSILFSVISAIYFHIIAVRLIVTAYVGRYCGFILQIVSGAAAGIFLVLLYAAILFFLFRLPDDPSYLARCAELTCPVTIACALGGYVFYRCVRGTLWNNKLVTDQF